LIVTKAMPSSEFRSASAAAFDPVPLGLAEERSPRRELNQDSYVLRAGGAKMGVELVDFSADGCCIAAPAYLWRGESLKLFLPWRGAVDATVRWCRDGKVGLIFANEEDERTERVERQESRIDTRADVNFRRIGKSRFKVAIHDMSAKGCKVEIVERPSVGEKVQVKFDGLEALDAKVRWVEGHEAGVEFDRPIHPAVFFMLAARMIAEDATTAL
jgi:hypothetical protein